MPRTAYRDRLRILLCDAPHREKLVLKINRYATLGEILAPPRKAVNKLLFLFSLPFTGLRACACQRTILATFDRSHAALHKARGVRRLRSEDGGGGFEGRFAFDPAIEGLAPYGPAALSALPWTDPSEGEGASTSVGERSQLLFRVLAPRSGTHPRPLSGLTHFSVRALSSTASATA